MEKYKKVIKSNKSNISAPPLKDKFELPDGSNSVSDIQEYFVYISKKNETLSLNPPIQICVNKEENEITFIIKTGCHLELLTPETIKILRSTKKDS